MNGSATQDNAGRSRGSTRRLFLDAARLFLDIRRGARTRKRKDEGQGMKFELLTELSPEEVIRRADEYYKQHTGLNVDERADEVLELAIGAASRWTRAFRAITTAAAPIASKKTEFRIILSRKR